MKKGSHWFLCLFLVLLLAACGKTVEERWQEQYDLGQKYLTELDYEQAIIAFTNAIEIDANRAPAYTGRAESYIQQRDYASAISDYTSALELDPDNIDLYLARGDAYNAIDDTEQALADYDHVLSLDEGNQEAADAAAEIHDANIKSLIADGDLNEAVRYIEDNDLPQTELTDSVMMLKEIAEIVSHMLPETDLYRDIQILEENEDVFLKFDNIDDGVNDVCQYFDSPIELKYPDMNHLIQIGDVVCNGIVYMIYYGEHNNGIPDGDGILIKSTYQRYVAKGTWANGKPNGAFRSLFQYGDDSYSEQSGQVIDGLWNGKIEIILDSAGIAYPQANHGHWLALDTPDENGMATIYKYDSHDPYYGLGRNINVTCGILGYAEDF